MRESPNAVSRTVILGALAFPLVWSLFIGPEARAGDLKRRVRQNDLHAVKALLEGGADPNVRDSGGWSPLHHAAEGGFVAICKLLIQRGAKVDAADERGVTPLHRAASHGHSAAVEVLLAGGASPGAVDMDGKTPLHLAAGKARSLVVKLLLGAGAKVNPLDKAGQTPIEAASHSTGQGRRATFDLLKARGGRPGQKVREANLRRRRKKGLLPKCAGFQDAAWGMTRQQVIDYFQDVVPLKGGDLVLSTEVAGRFAKVFFRFPNNLLESAVVLFDAQYRDPSVHETDYWRLHKLLTRKYGKPYTDQQVWKDERRKTIRRAVALSMGSLTLQSSWETDRTKIMLSCRGDGLAPRVSIAYTSAFPVLGPEIKAQDEHLDDL